MEYFPLEVKILVIEDDAITAHAIHQGLSREGYETSLANTGEEGFFLLNANSFDLAILDWKLPGRDGIEILKTFRARENRTPVLLLTARDSIEDRVMGLDAGADDYLVKPFAIAELLARLRALSRRNNREDSQLKLADLTLDVQSRHVTRGSSAIALTLLEFDLLHYLISHQDLIITRQMLVRDVWQEPARITSLDNVIDVHIGHLRKKIDEGHPVKLLHTIRGVGFTLSALPPR
jgi:DNA-binding response OmpR family regulator